MASGDAMRTLKWGVIFLIGVLVGSCLAPPCVEPSAGAQAAEIKQPTPPRAVSPYGDVQDAEVKVNFEDGHCTGVLISPNPNATESRYITSAEHCFVAEGSRKHTPMTGINDEKMTGEVIANDGNDHVIVRLSKSVKGTPVWFGAPIPPPGTQVFAWGNPGGLEHQLRTGTVTGLWANPHDNGRIHVVVDLNNWHGDSGGPVFDMQGRLISLNNGYYYDTAMTGATFRIGLIEPFQFKPEQLRGIP